jgi:RsiW-degrading membrane proteinase PrsW (M82 family)
VTVGPAAGAPGPRSARSAPVRPTPRWARGHRSLRRPAFWLLAALLVVGAWRVVAMLRSAWAVYPIATGTALVLFALYAVPFVLLVRVLDYLEREPPLLLAAAFGWGGLVAVATAIPGNAAVSDLTAKLGSPAFAATWGPALAGPLVEEPVKVLGVVMVVLVAGRQINSVIDGFVYGAFVGLGFQVVEDVLYAVNAVALAGRGDRIDPVVVTFLLRGFLGGLWSHTLFSSLAGAGVGYFVVRRDRPLRTRVLVAVAALAAACLFHAVWNSPLLADGFGYGAAGVLAAILVKGLPALVATVLLVGAAGRREAEFYGRELAQLGDPRIATPEEVAALGSARTRAAARRYAQGRVGFRGVRAVRDLQQAQARLAVELSRGGDRVRARLLDVLAARRRLYAYGHPQASAPAGPRPIVSGWITAIGVALLLPLVIVAGMRALGGG